MMARIGLIVKVNSLFSYWMGDSTATSLQKQPEFWLTSFETTQKFPPAKRGLDSRLVIWWNGERMQRKCGNMQGMGSSNARTLER